MFPEYADTAMEDNEEEGQGEEWARDEPVDDLGQVISDARRGCDTEKERLQFEQMFGVFMITSISLRARPARARFVEVGFVAGSPLRLASPRTESLAGTSTALG